MKITGTIVNYYIHCRRQCWLFANRITLEDNSEAVRMGKILHQLQAEKNIANSEIQIENIKIDKITDEYLIEMKKSDADVEAVRWQTLYYLKVLRDKGIERRGRIQFIEKNKQTKKVIDVELTPESIEELQKIEEDIMEYISQNNPDPPLNDKKCKRCAYYEYCYI